MQCNYGNKKKPSFELTSQRIPEKDVCLCDCNLVKSLLAQERHREAESREMASSSKILARC